jgi:hypothetical protein
MVSRAPAPFIDVIRPVGGQPRLAERSTELVEVPVAESGAMSVAVATGFGQAGLASHRRVLPPTGPTPGSLVCPAKMETHFRTRHPSKATASQCGGQADHGPPTSDV